ncbi:SIR2 family protein [Paenibacillus sp. PvP091]|uniref:SIR2 family protein n=1 Tax=Paenibacillus sp. PvP091 TaxID=2806590 RepID=UPI0032AF15EC
MGEIFKVHGCTSKLESLVFNSDDYKDFGIKKKYLSAKLLTYFAEHPLLFVGYSAEDPNIKAILSDIDEIISSENELIPNIYILEWDENAEARKAPPREKLISISPHRSVRIKSITASHFEWVFKAFGTESTVQRINPKILRSLMARTYDLVRVDIPKRTIEVDFQVLQRATSDEGELAKLYGITTLSNPTALNAGYPYSLTHVGQELGYPSWHKAHFLIEKVRLETGIDIKSSDNQYHIRVKIGNSTFGKYSDAAVELLKQVRDGIPYEVSI